MQAAWAQKYLPAHVARANWLAEGRVGSISAVFVALAAYFLIQIVVMTALSHIVGTGVGVDDAEQLMYMGELRAGYGGSQPPLYSWFAWTVAQIFGPTVLTLKIVKYAMVFTGLASIVLAVLRMGYSRHTALTAMFGVALFPQILWEMQHTLSHSVAVFCFCSLLLLAFVELVQRRTTPAYAAFGLALAAAILAKYNDLFLIGALLAAALSLPSIRPAIMDRRILLSVAIALLACAPTLYWNLSHPEEFLSRGYKFGIGASGGPLTVALAGIGEYAEAIVNFSLLPVAVFGLVSLACGISGFRVTGPARDMERLLWRTLAVGVGVVLILVLASGATAFRDRWMLPILLFLPLAMAMRMERLGEKGRTAQIAVICLAAGAALLVMPFTWYIHLHGGSDRSSIARMDYSTLYRDLTADGPINTVIADWHWIGNLRLADPDLVIMSTEVPGFAERLREPARLLSLDRPEPRGDIVDRIRRAGYELAGPPRELTVPMLFTWDQEKKERRVFVADIKKSVAAPAGSAPAASPTAAPAS